MRLGELCAGYGGLGMGIQQVINCDLAWVSDIDKGANKILAHRFPGVPNIGDMTTVNWRAVERVDVLAGGTPCQDLSHAGKRAGMSEGTRSNLWVAMREAIAAHRPSLVVWENVSGAYSANATSNPERVVTKRRGGRTHRSVVYEGGLLEDAKRGPALRALGRVLGDLATLGYDAAWHGLRAADVGAPHGRLRVFVLAWPAADAGGLRRGAGWPAGPAEAQGRRPLGDVARRCLLPTPRAGDGTKGGPNQRGSSGDLMLPSAVQLLPTPTTADHKASGSAGYGGNEFCTLTDAAVRQQDRWGQYADAIHRWEQLTRPAPAPTEPGRNGNPRLSPRFSEWLMGVPDGWITDVPGITRNEALRACGNGVVPQQAAAALRFLLTSQEVAA